MQNNEDASLIEINVIDNSRFRAVLDPTFIVLGMLDEYIYRMDIHGPDHVERFYPAEKAVADSFVYYLAQIASQQRFQSDITVTESDTGHIYVQSPLLARYIRSLYAENYFSSFYDDVTFTGSDGSEFKTRTYGIAENMFPAFSHEWRPVSYEQDRNAINARLSYLIGVHLRYGKDYSFQLANAPHKIDLIISFLTRMGANRISKSWTIKAAPVCTDIQFDPDEDLARIFNAGLAKVSAACAQA